MQVKEITFLNGTLQLEGRLWLPGVEKPYPGVVLCHPHPLYGGNMVNNVIVAVGKALEERGIATLHFNFRGVGRSQGSFADGIGEQDDARAALAWLAVQGEIDPSRLGIFGYSFGGLVALNVGAREATVKAMAAVSPLLPRGVLNDCPKPKLIICGDADTVVLADRIRERAAEIADPKIITVTPGADHFWLGQEREMASAVADFFSREL